MFEDIAESRSRSGLRGFAYRHFGKIVDADQAKDEIKLYSIVFFALGLFSLVVGLLALVTGEKRQGTQASPFEIVLGAVILLALTGSVRVFRSRVSAILIFGLEVLSVLSFHLFSILWAAFAWRLVQACFAFRRFSRGAQPLASTTAVPPVIPPPPPPPPNERVAGV